MDELCQKVARLVVGIDGRLVELEAAKPGLGSLKVGLPPGAFDVVPGGLFAGVDGLGRVLCAAGSCGVLNAAAGCGRERAGIICQQG